MDDPSSTSVREPAPEPSRPVPAPALPERCRAWFEWFGVARLVAAGVATVVVCGGAYWLMRVPPPPTEAALPRAAGDTSAGGDPAASLAAGDEPVDPTGRPTTAPVVVHVAGAVASPGVYTLSSEARVHEVVEAAGGFTPDAEPDALNLAGRVEDGSRVYVPRIGEPVPAQADPVDPGPVDVNRAGVPELDELPGVGPATAAAIVTERERNGPFASVDDLERVPGIGPAKLAALRDLVRT